MMVALTRVLKIKVEENGLGAVVLSGSANGDNSDRKGAIRVSLMLSYEQFVKSTTVTMCSLVPKETKHSKCLLNKRMP